MTNDVEHLFMCLLSICISSLEKAFQVLVLFFSWSFCLYFWVVRIFVLYILNTELLSDVWFANIFSHFVEFLYFLDNVIWRTKVLNFDKVPFTYFLFCSCACGIKSKNLLPNLKSRRFTPLFSSNSFRAFSSVQSLSHVQLPVTPWTRPPCPSPTPSLLRLMSIESVMPSSRLIFWCPLLLHPFSSYHLCHWSILSYILCMG